MVKVIGVVFRFVGEMVAVVLVIEVIIVVMLGGDDVRQITM